MKDNTIIKLSKKKYRDLLLLLVYSIMRSDQAFSEARKANNSAINAMKK